MQLPINGIKKAELIGTDKQNPNMQSPIDGIEKSEASSKVGVDPPPETRSLVSENAIEHISSGPPPPRIQSSCDPFFWRNNMKRSMLILP